MSSFQVYISGAPGTADDWRIALNAPEDELPALDENAQEVVRRMQVDESQQLT